MGSFRSCFGRCERRQLRSHAHLPLLFAASPQNNVPGQSRLPIRDDGASCKVPKRWIEFEVAARSVDHRRSGTLGAGNTPFWRPHKVTLVVPVSWARSARLDSNSHQMLTWYSFSSRGPAEHRRVPPVQFSVGVPEKFRQLAQQLPDGGLYEAEPMLARIRMHFCIDCTLPG